MKRKGEAKDLKKSNPFFECHRKMKKKLHRENTRNIWTGNYWAVFLLHPAKWIRNHLAESLQILDSLCLQDNITYKGWLRCQRKVLFHLCLISYTQENCQSSDSPGNIRWGWIFFVQFIFNPKRTLDKLELILKEITLTEISIIENSNPNKDKGGVLFEFLF